MVEFGESWRFCGGMGLGAWQKRRCAPQSKGGQGQVVPATGAFSGLSTLNYELSTPLGISLRGHGEP
jgi:hypothetical protein